MHACMYVCMYVSVCLPVCLSACRSVMYTRVVGMHAYTCIQTYVLL